MSFKVRSFNEWTTDVFDEKTISNVINLKKMIKINLMIRSIKI